MDGNAFAQGLLKTIRDRAKADAEASIKKTNEFDEIIKRYTSALMVDPVYDVVGRPIPDDFQVVTKDEVDYYLKEYYYLHLLQEDIQSITYHFQSEGYNIALDYYSSAVSLTGFADEDLVKISVFLANHFGFDYGEYQEQFRKHKNNLDTLKTHRDYHLWVLWQSTLVHYERYGLPVVNLVVQISEMTDEFKQKLAKIKTNWESLNESTNG
ncbi:MAG: hypothetical protein CL489_10590 [Acidobacteria bacterium]|nr:hypothetical protein [Acidobacteriota bacterium]